MLDGEFTEEPMRVEHELGADVEENRGKVISSLEKVVNHFDWNKVVGCTITKEVASRIGVTSDDLATLGDGLTKLLEKSVGKKVAYWHTTIHTNAAGHHELVWGDTASEGLWRDKMVAVCTLGQYLSVVLFNSGQRVQTPPVKEIQRVLEVRPDGQFRPPEPDDPQFNDWAAAIDRGLAEMVDELKYVDRIVVVPTGRVTQDITEAVDAALFRTRQAAESKDCQVAMCSHISTPSVAQGAALCSLLEQEMERVSQALAQVVAGKPTVQELSEGQLQTVFSRMDKDCNGTVEEKEVREFLNSLLGSYTDVEPLFSKMDKTPTDGAITLTEFMDWWRAEVQNARVVTVTSAEAWRGFVAAKPPENYGDLLVLKVSFTFCRSCRKFAPVFRRMADKYPEVRFAHLVGNGTLGAMELATRELGVTKSPAFFVYRNGDLLKAWTGSKVAVFEENLSGCMNA